MLNSVLNYINKYSKKYIFIIIDTAFGNRAEEIAFGLARAKKEKKRIFLINRYQIPIKYYDSAPFNNDLLKIQSEYIAGSYGDFKHRFLRFVLTFEFFIKKTICLLFYKERNYFIRLLMKKFSPRLRMLIKSGKYAAEIKNSQDVLFKSKSKWDDLSGLDVCLDNLSISGIDFVSTKEERLYIQEKCGLPINAKFVCVHIRDGGFSSDYKTAIARNASIDNYYKAFNYLEKRGYYIVRICDTTMEPLPDKKFWIDVANFQFPNRLLHVLLIKACDFYIGMSSGPADVAALFEKDIIMTNIYSFYGNLWYKEGSLCLPKTKIRKSDNKILSFEEWLSESNDREFSGVGDQEKYHYIENTEKEILETVKYYLERPSKKVNPIQREANRIYRSYIREQFRNDSFNIVDITGVNILKYRWATRILNCKGGFCPSYLESNSSLLSKFKPDLKEDHQYSAEGQFL